jgi:hypothetical protein
MSTLIVNPNYKPHAKQILLHNAPLSTDGLSITLFGGSRGGGKSAAILADAVMFCNAYPGAKACILREDLRAVRQSFLDKLPSLFPQQVGDIKLYEYKENSSSYYPGRSIVFPNGSYITFQRVANYQEARQFQGYEFQFLAVDEVTKFDERTINYLLTTVRSPMLTSKYTGKQYQIPTKIIFGANPGGPGHKWVKQRFIEPTVVQYDAVTGAPLKTKDHITFIEHPESDKKTKVTVRFIPSSYKDNPYVADSYVANLMMQPEHMQKMDLFGNWDVVAGKMFELDEKQIVDVKLAKTIIDDLDGNYEIFISIDWGYNPSYHSAQWHVVMPDQRALTFMEMYGQDLIFEDFVKEINKKSEGMYISGTLLPHDMFRSGDRYRDDKGKAIGETKADVFDHFNLNPISVDSGKGKVLMRNDKIHSSTKLINEDGVPKFRISKGCKNLIEEFDMAVFDEFNPGMISKQSKDHALDAYGLFLIYYSDDISPIGYESLIKDNRPKIIRLLEEEEEELEQQEEDNLSIALDNLYDF